MEPIRILLVEDQTLMRQGLKTILGLEPGLRVVGEATDGRLRPLGDGTFAVGDARDPRRVRFEGQTAGGMAVAIWLNGGRWFRSFEE